MVKYHKIGLFVMIFIILNLFLRFFWSYIYKLPNKSTNAIDDKYDCNGNNYLKLKLYYEKNGGVIFKSCSLKNTIIDIASIYTGNIVDGKLLRKGTYSYIKEKSIISIATDEEILNFIKYINDNKAPFPFQISNFNKGTEQKIHSDIVHFDTLPVRGLMTAAWVALEDIDPRSGPLAWYPGSHKLGYWDYDELGLKTYDMNIEIQLEKDYSLYESMIESKIHELKLRPIYAILKKGEAFISAANLLHGGSTIRNKELKRYSQLTHYFLEGALSYWVPKESIPSLGKYKYKCDIPICTTSFGKHTNCINQQIQLFKEGKRMNFKNTTDLKCI